MSKLKVFDETVKVKIIRDDEEQTVRFCDLEDGDHVISEGFNFIVDDAHQCEDSHYDGWICYDTEGNDYYPEDFGASIIREG